MKRRERTFIIVFSIVSISLILVLHSRQYSTLMKESVGTTDGFYLQENFDNCKDKMLLLNAKFKFFISLFQTIYLSFTEQISEEYFRSNFQKNHIAQCFFISTITQVLQLPTKLYFEITVENKKISNKKDLKKIAKTFFIDLLKYTARLLVLDYVQKHYSFSFSRYYFYSAFLVVLLVIIYFNVCDLYTYLFRKSVPMDKNYLNKKIIELAKDLQFNVDCIKVTPTKDLDKQSDIYITVFGKYKQIILPRYLLEEHTDEEIIAVLCHKYGQVYYNHNLKKGVLLAFFILCYSYMINLNNLNYSFTKFPLLVALTFLGMLQLLMVFSLYYVSRAFIRQADNFTVMKGYGASLATFLKNNDTNTLSIRNNFNCFSLFSPFPPSLERIKTIEEAMEKEQADGCNKQFNVGLG